MSLTEPEPLPDADPGPLLRIVRDRRIAFVMVGGFNTAFSFALFVGFHQLFGDGLARNQAALLCSNVISIVVAFVLQRWLVFQVRGHLLLDFGRFVTVNLGMIGTNFALLPLLTHVVHLPAVPAQGIITVITVTTSYVGHSRFSFRRTTPAPDDNNFGVGAP